MRHMMMGGMHGGMGMMMIGMARRMATRLIIGVLLVAVVVLWFRQRRRF